MDEKTLICPYCGAQVPEGITECPNCHESLAAWTRLRYSHAIHYNEALALAREGRLDEAKVRLALALEDRESFAPAHVLLAKINAQQGRWAAAQQSAQRACELLPDDVRTRELADAIAQAADHSIPGEAGVRAQPRLGSTTVAVGARWLSRYQRDIMQAFAVGVGLTTVMALLIARLSGSRRD
jgi:tetratricopeptide (TPR) repeat protein